MTITVPTFGPIRFEGLSSDIKPDIWEAPGNKTQPVPVRSIFMELDTGDEYFYTGEIWLRHRYDEILSADIKAIEENTHYQKAILFETRRANQLLDYIANYPLLDQPEDL